MLFTNPFYQNYVAMSIFPYLQLVRIGTVWDRPGLYPEKGDGEIRWFETALPIFRQGKKRVQPHHAVVTYANMREIRAVDRNVELCGRDLAFIWLTQGQKPKRDAFYEFKGSRRFLHGKSRNWEESQGNLPHRESAPCIGQRPICVAFKYGGKEKDI